MWSGGRLKRAQPPSGGRTLDGGGARAGDARKKTRGSQTCNAGVTQSELVSRPHRRRREQNGSCVRECSPLSAPSSPSPNPDRPPSRRSASLPPLGALCRRHPYFTTFTPTLPSSISLLVLACSPHSLSLSLRPLSHCFPLFAPTLTIPSVFRPHR